MKKKKSVFFVLITLLISVGIALSMAHDKIPDNVLAKHGETIRKVDEIIEENNLGLNSKAPNLELKNYIRIISMGIMHEPEIKDKLDEDLLKAIRSLTLDISKETKKQTFIKWIKSFFRKEIDLSHERPTK